jgi:hypothetical protein
MFSFTKWPRYARHDPKIPGFPCGRINSHLLSFQTKCPILLVGVKSPCRGTPRATNRTLNCQARKAASPAAAPRVVTPRGTRTIAASRLRGVPVRGAGRVIRGHNYSAWCSGNQVRHGTGWWSFAALSTLGAIAIGSSEYYPYAYISAPKPYCEGRTEDGCELMWQEVETIEGDVVNQCLAYCPWQ